ncbi:ester cyclase [Geojedonia litorea]|uniref:Ester cyclase n=1 Tax=Geojedonia litorea TaxID=1268269 RepID=A0ABV9MYD3_9FLAO
MKTCTPKGNRLATLAIVSILLVSCQSKPNINDQNLTQYPNIMNANKNVVKQYVEHFNTGNLEGLRSVFSKDALVYGVLGWGKVDEVMPIWKALVEGLAIELTIEDMVAEGDIVAVRYTERGTSKAPFFDKPATGKSYELVAMEWFKIKDGKIERRWGARDATTQSKQLGWDIPASKADVKLSHLTKHSFIVTH